MVATDFVLGDSFDSLIHGDAVAKWSISHTHVSLAPDVSTLVLKTVSDPLLHGCFTSDSWSATSAPHWILSFPVWLQGLICLSMLRACWKGKGERREMVTQSLAYTSCWILNVALFSCSGVLNFHT